MIAETHTHGPVEYRPYDQATTLAGRMKSWCDVEGCRSGGAWSTSMLGHETGVLCAEHAREWDAVVDG